MRSLQGQSDAGALERDLRSRLAGDVRFDDGERALYATDASNYRQLPIGVVLPETIEDVIRAIEVCAAHGAPILARGGGTSLAGQCCNVAVVMDMSKYLTATSIDPAARIARVQPGVVLDDLRNEAERSGLTFGPDPATHDRCTLGGMIGNNSCGAHSVMAGKTVDNVETLDVITYDGVRMDVGPTSDDELDRIVREGGRRGEIYRALRDLRDRYAETIRARFPSMPRRVSGYNLDELMPENGFNVARALVGTEGTCVTVLGATVTLVASPPYRALAVLAYEDAPAAGDAVMDVMGTGPIALEGIDAKLVEYSHKLGVNSKALWLLPRGGAWLIAEFGGATEREAVHRATEATRTAPAARVVDDPIEQRLIWSVRASALGTASHVPGEPMRWEGWEDAAVPPERLGDYLRDFATLLSRFGYTTPLYGHFGHGCIHTRIDFDLTNASGISNFRGFVEDAADLVVSYGGSLSGEHGDGQARAELLPKMFGAEIVEAFREFKAIWDPRGKMNPGKVVNPRRLDDDLRLGTSWQPHPQSTHFAYPEDGGDFARAMVRCVGVGKCRQTQTGVMCPSYMVTREEKHSTRGRAHLLFEMIKSDPIAGGWRDENVKGALDLCLSCKGCRSECPVGVDMATYKAEFLSHHYEGRLRPRAAYSMGLIHRWARLASRAPRLANALAGAGLPSRLIKAAAGVAPKRDLPAFAPRSFSRWFAERRHQNSDGKRVMLWPDTFNNYFEPQVAIAAVAVLEHAGFRVEIPRENLCCGRPLYDFGMLPTAKRMLREIVAALTPAVADGVTVVGLEPSCVAVFRDELVQMFPNDPAARALSRQTLTLTEFLEREGADIPVGTAAAIVQPHCHHRAVMGFDDEESLMKRAGLDANILDAGCCGMAGAFGFERDHYDVSVAVGERVLLPAVRDTPEDMLVIADGFSCKEQIRQLTGRRAVHVAEVLAAFLDDAPGDMTRK